MNAQVSSNNLIAINDPNAFVGAIVQWELSGNIDSKELEAAWASHGLDPKLVPTLPSEKVCLTRAVEDFARGERFKRRIKGEGGGYRLVREDKADQDVADYGTDCIVFLDGEEKLLVTHFKHDKAGEIVLDKDGEPVVDHSKHPLEDDLKAAFEHHQKQLSHRDISPWLCGKMMSHLKATTLKSNGGSYFVPRNQVEEYKKIKQAVESVSDHKLYMIQAMTTQEAIELVFDSIVREAELVAKQIEEELDRSANDDRSKSLGPRALEGRAQLAIAVVDKLKIYEELLGVQLTSIRERLDDVKVAAMEASLAARAAAKAEKRMSA